MRRKIDFDSYASNYNNILGSALEKFSSDVTFFADYKAKLCREFIQKEPSYILEYGCGIGLNLGSINKYFPNSHIYGCDISIESVKKASEEYKDVNFFVVSEEPIKQRFDFVFVANVFHHIPVNERKDVVSKVRSIMNKRGELFVFEHNPFNPITRRIVNSCLFDTDAVLLYPNEIKRMLSKCGFELLRINYILFFPPKLKILMPIDKILAKIPLGGQYFVHARAS